MTHGEHVAAVHAGVSVLLVLFIKLPCVGAGEEQTLGTATDRSLFPRAYGVLANEKLMLPVDVSDWPVKIDATHERRTWYSLLRPVGCLDGRVLAPSLH